MMSGPIDLKQVERRVFLSYHEDGIVDLCVGGGCLSLGFMIWFLPEYWFLLVASLFVVFSVYYAMKRSITVPRMGYVEFSQVRRRRIQYLFGAFIIILVTFNFLGIAAMIYPPLGLLIFESVYTMLILGSMGGLVFALIGFVSEIRRFYLYGIVIFGSALFTFLVPIWVLLPLFALGLVMVIYGVMLLYRFIQRYPKESLGEVKRG